MSLSRAVRGVPFRVTAASSRTLLPLVLSGRVSSCAAHNSASRPFTVSTRAFATPASIYPTSNTSTMPIETSMRDKLTREFAPQTLTIRNDSAKHRHHAAMVAQGGGNGETHFHVDIISEAFEGKTQIARHRAINNLMKDEFEQGLHALSLRTKTPAEAEKEQAWIKAQTGSG